MGKDEQHFEEQHLPTILTKDDFIISLILSEIKSIKRDMADIRSVISEHCKDFNEFQLLMSPFSKLDFKSLNKLLAIDPDSIVEAVHSTKTLKSANQIILPLIITLVLGLTLLGLREYVKGDNATLKPTTEILIPNRETDLWKPERTS